jgi:hypothetical protein
MRSSRLLATLAFLAAAPLPAQVSPPDAAVIDSTPRPFVVRPTVVRGLYVNRWAAISRKMWDLIGIARRTEVNALVIDVKDDRGYVLYRSAVPLAHAIGADTVNPMSVSRLRAVLDTMRANGILPIARIVVAKDPLLANAKREWAVKRRRDGKPWLDANGHPWLDPHQRGVWEYAADLAAEAVKYGFSEVQFDYVRFPDDPRLIRQAKFALANGRSRDEVIREQLGYLRSRVNALGVPMAIDVFGLTTTNTTDMGIGQRWEQFADQADVVLPMTYPSHYGRGTYGIARPNANPYDVIDHALTDGIARNRSVPGAAEIVPWYQDFTLGAPRYGAKQVRAQMQAGYDHGIRSWILWNPSSRYTLSALRPAILSEAEEAPTRVQRDSAAARATIVKSDTTVKRDSSTVPVSVPVRP